jgi:hypothetical protein
LPIELADIPLVPAVDEPDWPAVPLDVLLPLPVVALVSVQLPSEPDKHPVTVTVPDVLDMPDCDPLVPVELPVCPAVLDPVWPLVVPDVPLSVPLVLPLCADTLTAKAQASATPDAVVTSRLIASLLLMGDVSADACSLSAHSSCGRSGARRRPIA